MTKGNVTFILHKPQLSENIGACARGIKNFGFNKLILINPKPLSVSYTHLTLPTNREV